MKFHQKENVKLDLKRHIVEMKLKIVPEFHTNICLRDHYQILC